ncbi:MAG: hypothetical protein J6Q55_02600 [Clostridia bacterium]|nr:hypothetical protein [Clostridia bacterium]
MKKLKFLALVLAMVLMTCCMTGCFGDLFLLEHIEDVNGEADTSLATITKEEAVAWTKNYLADNEVEVAATQADPWAKYSSDKFSGARNIFQAKVGQEIPQGIGTIMFKFNVDVSAGNFYIVLLQDGVVYAEVSTTGSSTITVNNPSGHYVVLIAGESAKVSLQTIIQYYM